MTAKAASFFLPITKVAPTPDGFRMVTGTVSTERVDLDGQIADYGWAKKEAQAWFDIANVREQHTRNVVGKGLDLQLDDANKSISLTAKVVDPIAITKLDEGLFTGFSFGAKNVPGNPVKVVKDAEAPNGRIIGGKWVEISLADRPANPDSVLTIAKSADAGLAVVEELLGDFADTDLEAASTVEVEKAVDADAGKELSGTEAIHNDALSGARASIRNLIQQEVAEAEPGNTYQIQVLVDALSSLDCFETSEMFESQYGDTVYQMAQITDKETRRGLYKSVADALKKGADAIKANKAAASEPTATELESEPAPAAPAKAAEPDTDKALTPDALKAVLPDTLKAMLPELLKEHAEVLKETLADTFAPKDVVEKIEQLGKRAKPGGPVINPDAAGLRPAEKSLPVNQVLEPGDVPLEALQEIESYNVMAKSTDPSVSQSARRMLTKLKKQHGIAE